METKKIKTIRDLYSREWKIKQSLAQLNGLLNYGYGKTRKPLSKIRIAEIESRISELEKELETV